MKILSRLKTQAKKFVAVHEDYGYEIDSDEDLKKLQERLDERGKDDYIIREIV